jgi:hypothetical protein
MVVLSKVLRFIFPDHVIGKFAPSFRPFNDCKGGSVTAKMMAQISPRDLRHPAPSFLLVTEGYNDGKI